MRVRMFQTQFAELVKSGQKRQTIRPIPRRPCDMPKVGQLESWRQWSGAAYRSPQVELCKVELIEILRVKICPECIVCDDINSRRIFLDTDIIAQEDGFDDWGKMREWFEEQHGLPFSGILIRAKDHNPPND